MIVRFIASIFDVQLTLAFRLFWLYTLVMAVVGGYSIGRSRNDA